MKAGREQVFLYNFEDAEQLRKLKSVLLCMKARAKIVEPEWFGQPIGALAGLVEPVESEQGKDTSFSEVLMVLHGFSGSRIDTLLSKLRKAGVGNIPYKAVLTPTNLRWTGPELCEELKKEHEAMQQGISAHKVD